ncbi:putative metallopeptidase (Zinc) SprT family [Alkalibacterium sp. AK22]|uniref:SprT family protein n=1 Tax=Alkalibacterium sp. AK22 TaxID=1229520 RepID=UPI00044AD76D|nr:SprT family protein [Alkalibacterium sp. AK22]EXJ23547.1 putative metallopeptidase (Zinc) SprT family [Alkalibacterium sp. AK22]
MDQEALQELVEGISLTDFKRPFRHQAVFNSRLKTTGGRYHLNSHDLDFNPKVLDELGLNTLKAVIRHELCHYHLHLEGRGYRHKDPEFKSLLREVGGLRFVPTMGSNQPNSHWVYHCSDCQSVLKRKRRFNTDKYVCARCRGQLQLVGKETR